MIDKDKRLKEIREAMKRIDEVNNFAAKEKSQANANIWSNAKDYPLNAYPEDYYASIAGLNPDYKMNDDYEYFSKKVRLGLDSEKEKIEWTNSFSKKCDKFNPVKNPCNEIAVESNTMNSPSVFDSNYIVAASQKVESTISKEITSGISEEVIAYGLVHALSKQAEAIVGQSDLPLIKMTPSMLARIKDHLKEQLKEVEAGNSMNREGSQRRLIKFYEAAIALTER